MVGVIKRVWWHIDAAMIIWRVNRNRGLKDVRAPEEIWEQLMRRIRADQGQVPVRKAKK